MSNFNRQIKKVIHQHQSPVDTHQLWLDIQRRRKKKRLILCLWSIGTLLTIGILYFGVISMKVQNKFVHESFESENNSNSKNCMLNLGYEMDTICNPIKNRTSSISVFDSNILSSSNSFVHSLKELHSDWNISKNEVLSNQFELLEKSDAKTMKRAEDPYVRYKRSPESIKSRNTKLYSKDKSSELDRNGLQLLVSNDLEFSKVLSEQEPSAIKDSALYIPNAEKLILNHEVSDSMQNDSSILSSYTIMQDTIPNLSLLKNNDKNDTLKKKIFTSIFPSLNKWQFTCSAGIQNVSRKTSLPADSNRIQNIVPKFAYQIQCLAERPIFKGFAWNIGLRYEHLVFSNTNEYRQEEEINVPNGWSYEYIDLQGISTKKTVDQKFLRISTRVSKTYQRIRILDLSLGWNYKFSLNHWEGIIQYLFAYNLWTSTSGIYYKSFQVASPFQDLIQKNVGFSSQYSLGINYHLNQKSTLGIHVNQLEYHQSFSRLESTKDYFNLRGFQFVYSRKL